MGQHDRAPYSDFPDNPDPNPHGLPRAIATLRRPDGITIMEVAVRGDQVLLHEISSTDPGLVTGCSSMPVAGLPTELLALLVTTGYVAGRDALTATDAIARGLPLRLLSPGARRACELIVAIEAEVERQRRERDDELEDGQDA